MVWAGALGLGLALASPADAAFGRASGAAVTFAGSGPGGLKIDGKTSELTVSEASGKIRFVVALANLDTGMTTRNTHMRDKYLEVVKYPTAELVVDRGALQIPADGAQVTGSVAGTMTIHGQSKPVSVSYKAQRTSKSFTISGQANVNMKDFGITVPSYLGVTVKPEIVVSVNQATVFDV